MPVLYNANGQAELLDDKAAQAALAAGTHELPIVDPEGKLGSINHTEAPGLLKQGFKQPTPEQLQGALDKTKNESLGENIKGGLEGLGEMVAPAAGVAVEKAAGAKEADILRRRDTPGHLIGQMVGIAATAGLESWIAGGAKSAGAAVAKDAIETTVANRIGTTAAKMAVENATFAGKDEVAKMMVHDPDQSLDTAAANIGMAGLIGGVLGGAGQGSAELWKMGPGAKLEKVLEGVKARSSGAAADIGAKAGLEISPEIQAALGDDPAMHKAFQHLMESNTKAGTELQKTVLEFKEATAKAAAETLGKTPEALDDLHNLSKAETGKAFQESLAKTIAEKVEPIAAKYEALTEKFSSSVLGEAEKAAIADNVTKHIIEAGLEKGPNENALKLAQKVLNQLPKQETVQDLRIYVKGLKSVAPYGSDLYQTAKVMKNALNEAIDSAVGGRAGAEFKATQAEYGQFKGLLEDLNDRLRMGREGDAGAQTFSKSLREMSPEDVVSRLKLKEDSQLQALLAKEFPEVAQAAKEYELNNLVKASVHKDGGKLDLNKLMKNIEKLQPEHRNYLLDEAAQSRIKALYDAQTSLPGKMNSSGTAKTLDSLWSHVPAGAGALVSMITGHNPFLGGIIGQASSFVGKEVPDAGRLAMLKFIGSNSPTSAAGFAAATKMAGNILKGEKAVSEAVKMVFKGGVMAGTEGLSKQRDELKKQVNEFASNPEMLLKQTGDLGHYMPNHAALATQSSARALQYLARLKPNDAKQAPLDKTPVPNKAAEAKYNRALDIANKPLLVMDSLRNGTLTQTDVQHLAAMYPALTRKLQTQLGQEMIDAVSIGREIPYKTKMSLSLFMSQPLDSSLMQQSIAASQPLMRPMPPQAAPKITGAKLNHLQKLPNSYETIQQDRSARRTGR